LTVNIATEDELSEAVAVAIVSACAGEDCVGLRLRRNGNGYLRSRLPNFRQMAQREPVFVLTDLDDTHCATVLLHDWIGQQPLPPNLLLRIAVREVESWLLADRAGIAHFLGVSPNLIPHNSELITDPKSFLLNIAKRARREVRSELIVAKGAVASQGLGYNSTLSNFVRDQWSLEQASDNSDSLRRAVNRLSQLVANG
jgi:hypothetical protein